MTGAARADMFDHIIVGAGSAGCVLAERLSRDPDVRVLLVEAGGRDMSPLIKLAFGFGKMWHRRQFDWHYDAEPDPSLEGRTLAVIRGKVLGGSSSVNALNFVRGHPSDFDRWAANGTPDWSFAKVRPWFEAIERWETPGTAGRGDNGALHVRKSRYKDPIVDAWAAAGAAHGLPMLDDYNLAPGPGLSRAQQTLRGGRRWSAADAWLRPALRRSNLTVRIRSRATRILMEGRRAIGIAYHDGRVLREAFCRREVILSGGAINSPHLLMLSGIGDPAELARHGIACRIALPGVGANLQDHISAAGLWKRKRPSTFHRDMRLDRAAVAMLRAWTRGTGTFSDSPAGLVGFASAGTGDAAPDIQYVFSATSFAAHPYLSPFVKPYQDRFLARAALLRPGSRGHVGLASADPFAAPRIASRALEDPRDMATLVRGFGDLLHLIRSPHMDAIRGDWAFTAPEPEGEAALEAFIRRTAINLDHPAGTCRMGAIDDPDSVVDQELRVIGAEALRVIDASVFPDLTSGNINAPVLMIAARVADRMAESDR